MGTGILHTTPSPGSFIELDSANNEFSFSIKMSSFVHGYIFQSSKY